MRYFGTTGPRRAVALLLIVSHLCLFSGCATLAHRSSASGQHAQSTANCSGAGEVCPWLLGDAGLLLLGIVPGVIAFIVDFGTGAWRHADTGRVMTASDEVASAHLLFSPTPTGSTDIRALLSVVGLRESAQPAEARLFTSRLVSVPHSTP